MSLSHLILKTKNTKMTTAKVELPPKLLWVFAGEARYRGAYGGRGSGKTRSFAKMAAIRGYMLAKQGTRCVILCGREYMNSLDESSMEEVKQAISSEPWLAAFYDIGEKYIKTKCGTVKFTFTGLRKSLDSVKSKSTIKIAWIDEAETVSEAAWRKLLPTVREDFSEIWITWNPERKGSATDERFRQKMPRNARIVELNHTDNPWFPDVLEAERLSDQERLDDNTYAWIWEGAYLENSKAQIFHGKVVTREFTPKKDWDGPYYGLDWGFSQDPTAGTKSWIHDDRLYIEYDFAKVGLELDETSEYVKERLPDAAEHVIMADNARPESISYVVRNGLPKCKAVKKGAGSVEDGITFLRSFKEIVVHPRCTSIRKEFRLYSYKVDRLTEEVLPAIIDKNNHCIDSLRYGLEKLIKQSKTKPVGMLLKRTP